MSSEPTTSPTVATPAHLRRWRDRVVSLAAAHGMTNVRLFIRGAGAGLLVDAADDRDAFDVIALEDELERLLGGHVDVVTSGALRNPWDHADLERSEPL